MQSVSFWNRWRLGPEVFDTPISCMNNRIALSQRRQCILRCIIRCTMHTKAYHFILYAFEDPSAVLWAKKNTQSVQKYLQHRLIFFSYKWSFNVASISEWRKYTGSRSTWVMHQEIIPIYSITYSLVSTFFIIWSLLRSTLCRIPSI